MNECWAPRSFRKYAGTKLNFRPHKVDMKQVQRKGSNRVGAILRYIVARTKNPLGLSATDLRNDMNVRKSYISVITEMVTLWNFEVFSIYFVLPLYVSIRPAFSTSSSSRSNNNSNNEINNCKV
jgi:hypothetical protein